MKSRWLFAALLGLAVAALARLRTFSEPPERDITTYAVIAHELLGGRELYTDLWDHKPPAIHLTYAAAELIAGYGLRAVYFLSVLATVLTLAGVVMAVRRGSGSDIAALGAALFWLLIANDFHLQGNSPNTEVFINAALTWAFALLIRLEGEPRHRRRLVFGIGALFALATLYKHVAIAPVVTLALVHALVPGPAAGPLRKRMGDITTWAAVGALAWVSTGAYFALLGRFPEFRDAVFTYNRAYAGGVNDNVFGGFRLEDLFPPALRFLAPLIALLCLGALAGMRRAPRRWALAAAYLVGSIAATALHGGAYAHYYLLWLPPVVLGSAFGVVELWRILRPPARWLAPLTAAAAFLIAVRHELPSYTRTAREWSVERYGTEYVAAADLGKTLGRYLGPDQAFFNWGAESGLYFFSRRSPPAGTLYVMPLISGPLAAMLEARTIQRVDQEEVDLIIVNTAPYYPLTPGFDSLLGARYERLPGNPALDTDKPLVLYVRRGEQIDPRIVRWRYSTPAIGPEDGASLETLRGR